MIKRTIEISRRPAHLSAKLGQLIVQPFDAPKDEATSIPAEDIGIVVVDHAQVIYSHGALQTLLDNGACVVICGRDHQPAGLLLPVSPHTQQVERLRIQIDASKPTNKRLWQQVVIAKVRAQASNLLRPTEGRPEGAEISRRKLANLAGEVKSGDTSNVEAQAAKVYWAAWRQFGGPELHGWYRDKDGTDPLNAHLNYGYAILRAAVARALVAAGLHPALGLHHQNRANAFCLADDLMEPFRPLIDREAIALIREGREQLDQSNKARLLALLTAECVMDDQSGPLMVQLHRMTASLVRCLSGEDRQLAIPKARVLESTGEEPGQTHVSREEKNANTADFPSGGGG
ncbi:MAG: type II CRISPR-associated endonuclease Cas1 [Phycisphaerales bacterium JB063]